MFVDTLLAISLRSSCKKKGGMELVEQIVPSQPKGRCGSLSGESPGTAQSHYPQDSDQQLSEFCKHMGHPVYLSELHTWQAFRT